MRRVRRDARARAHKMDRYRPGNILIIRMAASFGVREFKFTCARVHLLVRATQRLTSGRFSKAAANEPVNAVAPGNCAIVVLTRNHN